MADNNGNITGPSISDEAQRLSDNVNGYYSYVKWEELKTKWIAAKLSDGSTDHTLYDSKRDAVRHQSDEFTCAYIALINCPNGISPLEAERFLAFTRGAYDAGMRLPDPDAMDGGKDPFMDVAQYDRLRGIVNGARY